MSRGPIVPLGWIVREGRTRWRVEGVMAHAGERDYLLQDLDDDLHVGRYPAEMVEAWPRQRVRTPLKIRITDKT